MPRPPRLPPPPRATPPPRALTTGANPRGTAIIAPKRPSAASTSTASRPGRSTGGVFRPQAPDFQPAPGPSPQYRQAVLKVFAAQPGRQQVAILRAAQRNQTPEGQIILSALGPHLKGANLAAISRGLEPQKAPRIENLPADIVGGLSAVEKATQLGSNGPGNVSSFGTMGPVVAKNAAKDIVNLPAEALTSVAIPVGEAAQGQWGKALHSVVDPYVQAFKHPGATFVQHPVDTALMFGGLAHPLTRTVDTGFSLARTGHLPDVKAEPVQLTGNLTHMRPDFSKYPLIRRGQKDVAKALYVRNGRGQLVPRSDSVRARLVKLEASRLVGQNERVRAAHRQEQVNQHAATVLQPRALRALHSVRTAARYNPEPALIPGAGVLARIADGTIRRSDTVARDLQTHLAQVAANRPNLTGFPKLLAEHDAYVKQLQAALGNKAFLRDPAPAFKAAAAYAKAYAPIEHAAHQLGHFRDMTAQALQRRALAHYAITHMGAKQDRTLGLVDANGHPLSTEAILGHLRGPHGTAGRMPAFTSDQARAGDRAFFVSGQRRPLPAAKGNTYFAFTHGLTHPGHEALLEQRVRMQGIVDAHHSMNRLADQLLLQNERTGNVKAWGTFQAAERDAPQGYQPIRLAQQFHPSASLAKALETGKVNLATLEEEAAHRSLDINSRLQQSSEPGTWGLIDQHAAAQLQAHENLISPGTFFRSFRGLTNQFRRVALATSFRHLPGVFQEQLIRAAAEGIGPVSLLAGRAVMRRAAEISPDVGGRRRIEMTGGTASGQALALTTRQVSRHFAGTMLEGPLTAFEKLMAAPGARQIGTAWRTWVKFTLQGTKHFLEENAQMSAIGKQTIADFGGRHGLLAAAMGHWGKMIDQAAHGVLDENTARQMGAYVRRVYGRWTDLTPGEQTALMFSPFGMWWTNSIAWLMRMPVDHPAGAAFFAALNAGTEKQRQALGLDMFSPHHLPLYQQGAIPIGGKLWAANYYSAFGVMNNPGETAQSLIAPWQSELIKAVAGQDWKGQTINSPANPRPDRAGGRKPTPGEIGTVIANSLLSSFVPLYTKAQTIVEGGGSKYDTSTLFNPETKKPNPGPLPGLEKAVMPVRLSSPSTVGSGSSGGWGGSRSSSRGSSGWGSSRSSSRGSSGWGSSSSRSGGWG